MASRMHRPSFDLSNNPGGDPERAPEEHNAAGGQDEVARALARRRRTVDKMGEHWEAGSDKHGVIKASVPDSGNADVLPGDAEEEESKANFSKAKQAAAGRETTAQTLSEVRITSDGLKRGLVEVRQAIADAVAEAATARDELERKLMQRVETVEQAVRGESAAKKKLAEEMDAAFQLRFADLERQVSDETVARKDAEQVAESQLALLTEAFTTEKKARLDLEGTTRKLQSDMESAVRAENVARENLDWSLRASLVACDEKCGKALRQLTSAEEHARLLSKLEERVGQLEPAIEKLETSAEKSSTKQLPMDGDVELIKQVADRLDKVDESIASLQDTVKNEREERMRDLDEAERRWNEKCSAMKTERDLLTTRGKQGLSGKAAMATFALASVGCSVLFTFIKGNGILSRRPLFGGQVFGAV